jgi:hypothetical protein
VVLGLLDELPISWGAFGSSSVGHSAGHARRDYTTSMALLTNWLAS